MNETTSPLLLSIKPRYAEMLFVGLKRAELRKRMASFVENRCVFVYVTSPIQELRGGFRVGQVWKGSPEDIWELVSNLAKMEKHDFDSYFSGCSVAFALEVLNVWEYEKPISLDVLRQKHCRFVVPQSWRYLRELEHDFLLSFAREKVRVPSAPDCVGSGLML